MSYAPEITGLELFTMPFRSPQACMMAPASSRGTARSATASGKPASRMQKEKPTAPQSNKTVFPSQPADSKPPTEQAEKADTPEKSVPEKKESEPVQDQKLPAKNPEPGKKQPSADKPESPQKELALDMSDHTIPAGMTTDESEETKRKEHEEAEAKRKAEWEARQLAKKQKEEAAIQKLQAMSDADAVAASTECVRLAIERITRRNMKECVSDHIQSVCRKDPAFARCVMHPKKSMIHCFQYINRMAKNYIKQEMEDNGIRPENGVYGGDVPDDLCYQWAVDYFNDPDAPEDKEKEEKFVPRPYVSAKPKSKRTSKAKKTTKKDTKKKQESENNYEQMSLGVS